MEIPKEMLSLAGEFAVASELCRRGIYAQLTLGSRKRTDLLVETETAMLRIQVKAKQGRNWPHCKGIFGENMLLIFVDYKDKSPEQRPDFYILTSSDWESFVRRWLSDEISEGKVILNSQNCPIWVSQNNFEGINFSQREIIEHKERWKKIEALLNEKG